MPSPSAASRQPAAAQHHEGLGPVLFAVLSIALGIVAGFGAFTFRMLIGLVHNLLFLGTLSWQYDAIRHTPDSPWGVGVILIPPIGAIVVVFLVKTFAPEAKGHGVPEVIDAIYYQKSVIRPVVAVIKSLASALSIGSGGSVGREGPIIQISAAFASWSGHLCRVARWQAATLVAAGGGAGIAATFNTPIGGVLFAAEVLMHEISVRTLVPVALSTATATYVGHFFFGNTPAFPVPALSTTGTAGVVMLPAYLGLGVVMAFVAVAFIRGLYGAEDFFEKYIPNHEYLRHITGMFGVGLIIVLVKYTTGHYHVEGVGYATIMDVLSGTLTGVAVLVLLFALKLLVTCLTLGSGGSGGIFSPSLVMGTTLGAAYAIILRSLFPAWQIDPAALALAGMAGLVAGATGAALTAIVMIFEMTLDYTVVLPMTLTVAVAYGMRRLFVAQSIYTMKLARRGHYAPQALQANASLVHHVSDLQLSPVTVLSAETPVSTLQMGESDSVPSWVVLVRGELVVGLLSRERCRDLPATTGEKRTLADVAVDAGERFVTISTEHSIVGLVDRMRTGHASLAVVFDPATATTTSHVLGVVTLTEVAELIAEGMEIFAG